MKEWLFKLKLNAVINDDMKLKTFLTEMSKDEKDFLLVKKYFGYVLSRNTNVTWLNAYLADFTADEFLDDILMNYNKMKKEDFIFNDLLQSFSSLTEDEILKHIDKLVTTLECDDLVVLIGYLRGKDNIINHIIEKHITEHGVGLYAMYAFLYNKIGLDKVREYEDDVIKNNLNNLFIFQDLAGLDDEFRNKIKSAIGNSDDYLDGSIDVILRKCLGTDYVSNMADYKTLSDTLKLAIKEICQNEGVTYGDLEYLGAGGYSYVIGVGNKVIKIGKERETKTFPNNPYIIAPLMRESIPVSDNGDSVFLEVMEKVDTKTKATEEDLYQLYKKIRNIGLIWTDAEKGNVGFLLKDNIVHWNDPLSPSDESLELGKFRDAPLLKKGELALLDADSLYDEKTPGLWESFKYNKYELRYREERAKEIGIEIPRDDEISEPKKIEETKSKTL